MNNSNDKQVNMDMIAHDLRGPLTNIQGFYAELELSINHLLTAINEHQELLPDHINEKIVAILNDDVDPCLHYSRLMIGKMNEGLDKLEGMRLE